MKQFPLQGNF